MRIRFDIWLHPFDYYNKNGDLSHQPVEAMFGRLGRADRPRLRRRRPLPDPLRQPDFILAAIGEELGLTAVIAVIMLYGLIVERALRTALICRDGFGKLLATGLGSVFALQVFVVVGGVTGLIPLTGLTTPVPLLRRLLAHRQLVIIALLLRISDQARRPVPQLSDDTSAIDSRRHSGGEALMGHMTTTAGRCHEQADPDDLDLLPAAVPGADGERELPAVLEVGQAQRRRPAQPARAGGVVLPASAARSWWAATARSPRA